MKKLFLLMLASMFMVGDVCLARVDSNTKDMDERQVECYTCGKPMKKCKCKKEKAEKEKKHKQEKVKKEHKVKEHKVKEHKVKAHKQEKVKKEHKAKEHKVKEHKVKKEKEHKEHKVKEHKQEKVKKEHRAKEHKVKEHKVKKEKEHKEHKVKEHKQEKVKKEHRAKEHKVKEHKVKKEKEHKVKEHKQEKVKKEHRAKEHKVKEHKVKKEKEHKVKEHKQEKVKKEHRAKEHKVKEHKVKKEKEHKEHKVKEHKPKKVKMDKEEKKHEKRQADLEQKRRSEEKAEQRALKNEAKSMHKREREHHKQVTGEQKEEEKREELHAAALHKRDEVTQKRAERRHMMASWERAHDEEVHRDLTAGKYSELYILPAIPQYAYWYEGGKNFFNAGFHYDYACNAYGSDGGSSERNITQLAFGEDQITLNGISLAAKLANAGTVAPTPAGGLEAIGNATTGDISLIGKEEKYQIDLEIGRYIFNRDVAIGLNLPVLYNRHRLKTNLGLTDPVANAVVANTPDLNNAAVQGALKNLLAAKGFTEMGGSAMGLGDLSVYANCQLNSVHFEKLVLGVRFVVPTGKKASSSKLWAPELGNGGFFEALAYGAVAMSYHKYLNPFVTLEGGFFAAAHVDRRVPRLVTLDSIAAAPVLTQAQFDAAEAVRKSLAFGDRIALRDFANANDATVGGAGLLGFSGYDSTVNGFADQVNTVKVTPGPELKFRVGDSLSGIFCRRGQLDVFYDFRAKGKDKAKGLSNLYDLSALTKHTVELDHKVGVEYSYQHSLCTRTHVGILYTFAGMNVPKTFEVGGSFNHAF